MPSLSDRRLLLLPLALNALVKFSWLGVNELSGDEPFTVFWALQPFDTFLNMLRTENNPPLHFLLVKAWSAVVPLEESWLRLPSAVFSALTVAPLFLLARLIADRTTAVIAGLLFTLNNHQYTYAHEVRGYALLLLLALLALWLITRIALRGDRAGRRPWMLPALVFIALVYTHFFGWLVIGLTGVCVMLIRELRPARRAFFIAMACAVLAFLPYALIFLQRAGESIVQGTWVKPHGAEEIWHMVRRWSNQPVVTALLLIPIIIDLVRQRTRPLLTRLALWWWLTPLLGLWLVQWIVPAYVDRYLLFASPGFYLLAARGLAVFPAVLSSRWPAPAVGVAAMAITFTPWKDNGQHPSAVAAQVRAWQRSPDDPPVLVHPFFYKLTFQWAMDPTGFLDPPWRDPWSPVWNGNARSIDDPEVREVVVVSALAADDPQWVSAVEALQADRPLVETAVPMEGVRVLRFSR